MDLFFSSLAPSWEGKEGKTVEEADAILAPLDLRKGDRAIDVACGKGVMTGHLARKTKSPVLGVDISQEMIALAKKDYEGDPLVSFLHADFLTLEGEYDKALIFDAYPHFKDLEGLRLALARIIRKGGLAYVVHDLGKDRLNAHHANMDPALFRDIEGAMKEAKYFLPDFEILFTMDEEDRYGFLLQRR